MKLKNAPIGRTVTGAWLHLAYGPGADEHYWDKESAAPLPPHPAPGTELPTVLRVVSQHPDLGITQCVPVDVGDERVIPLWDEIQCRMK